MQKDPYGRQEIHHAVIENNITRVKELISSGVEVNHRDKNGWTPLHFAAQAQSSQIVVLLIEAGAKIDVQDVHGNTPLQKAIFNYRGEGGVIEVLLKHGADPNIKNKSGNSPADLGRMIANYDVAKYFK